MNVFDYRVVSIDSVAAPHGKGRGNWQRYVIANKVNCVTGYRPGSTQEVLSYAEQCVERLNGRYRPATALRQPAQRWPAERTAHR